MPKVRNYQFQFNMVILNQDVSVYAKDPLTGFTDNKSPKKNTKSLLMEMRESFFHKDCHLIPRYLLLSLPRDYQYKNIFLFEALFSE